MPQRFLKPGIVTSRRWDACSWAAQSFYIRIVTLVDDFGRYEADPVLLKSHAFPIREDVSTKQVVELCKELHQQDLAIFYERDGKQFIQLTNWTERPRASVSKFQTFDNTCKQMFADVSKCCAYSSSSSPSSPQSSPVSICSHVGEQDPNLIPPRATVPKPFTDTNRISALHSWYETQMGCKLRIAYDLERQWFEFFRAGFDEDKFKSVFKYLRGQIKAAKRNDGALKLSNLLQLDKFQEDLALATAARKPMQPQPAPATTPDKPPTPEAMAKGAEQFKALKEAIG